MVVFFFFLFVLFFFYIFFICSNFPTLIQATPRLSVLEAPRPTETCLLRLHLDQAENSPLEVARCTYKSPTRSLFLVSFRRMVATNAVLVRVEVCGSRRRRLVALVLSLQTVDLSLVLLQHNVVCFFFFLPLFYASFFLILFYFAIHS